MRLFCPFVGNVFYPFLREDPIKLMQALFGHCPFGWMGLNAWPDGLGHFFREEFA